MESKETKLYVGNFTKDTVNSELEDLFAKYGTVTDIFIVEGAGFGFITFQDKSSAEKARQQLDGSVFKDRTLRVNIAKPER